MYEYFQILPLFLHGIVIFIITAGDRHMRRGHRWIQKIIESGDFKIFTMNYLGTEMYRLRRIETDEN